MAHLVLLLRHARAEESGPDAARRLTAAGIGAARAVAAAMRALALEVEVVLTSPLARARETATIVAEAYGLADRVVATPALAPGAGSDGVVAELGTRGGAASILLVGHQPDLGELASTLLVGTPGLVPLPFGKAALAAISLASLPASKPGTLEFFLTAEQLALIGMPR